MAQEAQYRVHIPTISPTRRPLWSDLPDVARQWIHRGNKLFQTSWIEGPHQGPQQPEHHLVVMGEDTPESDSRIKQLAAHIGDLSGHRGITAIKTGPKTHETWFVPNLEYKQ